jgi:probable F420-dependent oxidoreductase
MKIGAVYPQIELGGRPEPVKQIGQAVEELGYHHLVMYDHVVGAHPDREPALWGPYTDKDPFHDPLVAFAYLAGITTTLKFLPGVIILPQRQTVLLAQQAADLDLLSGQRLIMGVGTGWNYVEYHALGEDFDTRGKRMSEQIEFLRKLWGEPLLTFDGQFDQIDRACINPRPDRQIPIYCGGFSEPAFKRAARLADGFIFAGAQESALEGWQSLQKHLKANGRDPSSFDAIYFLQTATAAGLPTDEVPNAIERWQAAGGSGVSVVTMGLGYKTAEQHLEHFHKIADCLQLGKK